MNKNFQEDCEQWAIGKQPGMLWKLKHYILFPTFRIVFWKRIGENTHNSFLLFLVKLKLWRYQNKYLITMPYDTHVGGGISFPHGGPVVITGGAKIGKCAIIHPNVLIGGQIYEGCPTLGNRVFVGNGAKIIGKIKIGDDVFIAPGTVVVKDIPTGSVVVGNPSKIINQNGPEYVKKYLYSTW